MGIVVVVMVEATTPNLSKGVMKKVVIVPCTSIRQVPLPHQEAEQVKQELLKAGMPNHSFKLQSLEVIKAQQQIKGGSQSPKPRLEMPSQWKRILLLDGDLLP